MRLTRYSIKNFRRLEDVTISLEQGKTVFVGANNVGKTSATAVFKLFTQRAQFKIHDFSAGLIAKIDALVDEGAAVGGQEIPAIQLDLWFAVDPATEYGRVAFLMPALTQEIAEVGIRLRLALADVNALLKAYEAAFPIPQDGSLRKRLSYFLGIDGNLRQYFSITYDRIRLESEGDKSKIVAFPLDAKDGRATLTSLLRVDYVDAQRNIDDESSSRSNQLSSVFYDFYTSNLKELPSDADALRVIEKSNSDLTAHYKTEFVPLMGIIAELGYPTLNDRELKVLSNLSPEKALGGNALLSYQDPDSDHELPEAYNGLGFKNLVYIAIQIAHFQIQWRNIKVDRPLCHLIFIEEPEVHLHVQVQQTFLTQIEKVINKTVEMMEGEPKVAPQLVLTTHSSHIVSVAEFKEVRYFKKVLSSYKKAAGKVRNTASQVLNLAAFDETKTDAENLNFLRKYLALPHCDLFFADAAIMIEGTVERLMLPQIIQGNFPGLLARFITTLQVGGAFAHRFVSLLEFLGLPCLIITDLDSVDPAKRQSTCIGGHPTAVTSNATIKELLLDAKNKKANDAAYKQAKLISSLNQMKAEDKTKTFGNAVVKVAFQTPVHMPSYGKDVVFIPRTFEESFIFHNIDLYIKGNLRCGIEFDDTPDALADYYRVHSVIHSDFAKVDFVLGILTSPQPWIAPTYCVEGLQWLSEVLA